MTTSTSGSLISKRIEPWRAKDENLKDEGCAVCDTADFPGFSTRFVSLRSTVRGSSPSMMAGSRETSSTGPPVCHMLGL